MYSGSRKSTVPTVRRPIHKQSLTPSSNFVTIPIIYFFYPETGSRSLEEIDTLFQNATVAGKPWTSIVALSKTEPRWYDKDGQPTEASGGDGSTTLASSDK